MTIANGKVIEESDLNAAFASFTARLRAANARDAGVHQMAFDWPGLTPTTPEALRVQTFTVGDDDVELLDFGWWSSASGETVVTLGSGPLVTGPTEVRGGLGDAPRYAASPRPLQVLLRGATYTMTAETAATVTDVRAFLLLRTRPRRR